MRTRRIPRSLIALALSLPCATAALPAEPFRPLDGREIRARLTGMEFSDEVHWAHVFGRDGRLRSVSMGRKSTGTWRVERDELCLKREGEERRCYRVWASSRTVQLREPGTDVYEEGTVQKPQQRQ
ncbi:hypothetical protein [Microvirga massiliensis]|uniref:hypothetical protein n=1 Tax=Microvirga massiliensis TaxID=1033741 RepID=UPI001FCD0B14|nr:hypothetical protein [Microvirga massiliensis]